MFDPVDSLPGDRESLDKADTRRHRLNVGSHSNETAAGRRRPTQRRAKVTVEAVLDAVSRIIEREGVTAVTTNRIAEVAGVSIGSVYQYFSDKRAIFIALRDRHAEEMVRLLETTLVENAAASLEDMVRVLVDAMVAAHDRENELNQLLWSQVPHRDAQSERREVRVRGAWRLALAGKVPAERDLDRTVYFVQTMSLALVHAIMSRPKSISLAAAKDDVVRAVLAYVTSSS